MTAATAHDGRVVTATRSVLESRTGRRRPGLAVVAGLNAMSAWAGAAGLALGWLDVGDGLNQRLPLDSPVLAGAALAVIVAAPFSVLARCAWHGDPRTAPVAVLAGGLLVGWIAVQVVFLREFSWFQPTYAAIGAAFIAAGRRMPAPG